MKKALALIIISALGLAVLSGCNQNTTPSNSANTMSQNSASQGSPAQDKITISRTTDPQGVFTPIDKTKSYGMILYSSAKISLKQQGQATSSIELFVKGEQSGGKISWDDGQNWYLIVRDGKGIFKLLDETYVQNGQVNYWYCWSYDDNAPYIIVMVQQGAGISQYKYSYDKSADVFYRTTIYSTQGNMGVLYSNTWDIKK